MPTKQAQDPFKKIQEEKEQELREAQARAQREADERDKRTSTQQLLTTARTRSFTYM